MRRYGVHRGSGALLSCGHGAVNSARGALAQGLGSPRQGTPPAGGLWHSTFCLAHQRPHRRSLRPGHGAACPSSRHVRKQRLGAPRRHSPEWAAFHNPRSWTREPLLRGRGPLCYGLSAGGSAPGGFGGGVPRGLPLGRYGLRGLPDLPERLPRGRSLGDWGVSGVGRSPRVPLRGGPASHAVAFGERAEHCWLCSAEAVRCGDPQVEGQAPAASSSGQAEVAGERSAAYPSGPRLEARVGEAC
mmetsp:Transcript_37792/g.82430  ORF Transcript_37792/g.82430 Transcript_37792/m.82430 type:complete len:244 (+) Transcript_37792:871-1602(+)